MPFAPPAVLIVDDYEDAALLLATLLSQHGYPTLVANSAPQALDLARREQPGLIVLDLHMPGMDGLMFLREQAGDAWIARIPVLVSSGSEEACQQAMEAGAMDCMVKPLDLTVFLQKVADCYARRPF